MLQIAAYRICVLITSPYSIKSVKFYQNELDKQCQQNVILFIQGIVRLLTTVVVLYEGFTSRVQQLI